MISEELKQILLELEIGNEEFFLFIEGKVKVFDLGIEYWGCFPILDELGYLKDIRVLVPNIIDELTLKANIHELAHAYELFQELNEKYIEKTEERELNAILKEEEYMKKLKNKGC